MFFRRIRNSILRFIRSAGLALLLIAASVSCKKPDSQSDNAFRNRLAELDWGDGETTVPAGTFILYYGEQRLGRKNAFVPTIEKILGKAIEV